MQEEVTEMLEGKTTPALLELEEEINYNLEKASRDDSNEFLIAARASPPTRSSSRWIPDQPAQARLLTPIGY